jgi:hypothetical protein
VLLPESMVPVKKWSSAIARRFCHGAGRGRARWEPVDSGVRFRAMRIRHLPGASEPRHRVGAELPRQFVARP